MVTLNDRFLALKEKLEPGGTLTSLVQQRHNAVRGLIQKRNPNVIDTKLIGSVGRKTRIQPRPGDKFDIDILVVMGSFYSWLPPGTSHGITPQKALDGLRQTIELSDRYGSMGPRDAPPTITMTYADNMTIEFVPAYLDQVGTSPNGVAHTPVGRAYWVPKNGAWELADYDYEAKYISTQNDASDKWLIPLIKMIKAVKRNYFPAMKSFHLDIIVTTIIPILVATKKQHGQAISYPGLIGDFFGYAPQFLPLPIKIPGSHSPEIALTQSEAVMLTNAFSVIKKYIDTFSLLPESKRVEGWKVLFGDPFPIS